MAEAGASPAPSAAPMESTASPSVPMTAEDCTTYARALCAAHKRCSEPGLVEQHGNEATCVANEQRRCEARIVVPHSGADQAWLRGCVDALGTMQCQPYLPYSGECSNPRGELSDGEACVSGVQCAGGACRPSTEGCGKCEVRPREGEACSDRCEDGFRCAGGTCVPKLSAGQQCRNNSDCHAALSCVRDRCVERGKEGDPCGDESLPTCGSSLTCQGKDGRCVKKATASLGEACEPAGLLDFGSRGQTLCPPGSLCTRGTGKTPTCQSYLMAGESCEGRRLDCSYPSQCLDGTCTIVGYESCQG